MKKTLLASCIVAGMMANGWAAERTWTGGGGSTLWSMAQNWQDEKMPLAGDVAVFGGVQGTVTVDVSTPALAGVRVTSGALELVPANGDIRLNGAADCVFEIGAGAILTNSVYTQFPANAVITKAGAGGLTLGTNFLASGSAVLDIGAGAVSLLAGVTGDGLGLGSGSIIVRDGAALFETSINLISNRVIIDVREGGVFDGMGNKDTIGAIIGNGTLRNVTAQLTLPDWKTYQFDGNPAGAVLTLGDPPSTKYSTGRYRIANAYNHTNALLTLNETNVLTFAAGLGECRVGRLTAQLPTAGVTLEDEAGAPVQLFVGQGAPYTGTWSVPLDGSGGLGITNMTQTVTNALPYRGPTILEAGTTLFLGNGVAEGSISNSASLHIGGDATFAPRPLPFSAQIWDKPTFGGGTFQMTRESASFDLRHLSMTNGTVSIGADNSTNRVTLAGGQSADTTFKIYARSELAVTGGSVSGGAYEVQAADAPVMRLSGGSSTNVDLALNTNGRLEVTGGSHIFRSALSQGSRNAMYHQSGGISGFTRSNAHDNTNNVFIVMTGGTMYNLGDGPGYFRGLGATLSNDTRFIQRDTIPVRIASDGNSHTVRLCDQSYMELQNLQMMSKGSTGTSSSGHVIVQDNATLALRGGINLDCDASNTAELRFNGGTLRLIQPSGTVTFPRHDYADYWIDEGGMNLDIQTSGTLVLNASLKDGTGAGTDGGLTKTGIGDLLVNADQFYTGPTILRDQKTRVNRLTQTFYGDNEIHLQGSLLEIAPEAIGAQEIKPLGPTGTLAYDYGFASLLLNRPGSISTLTVAFPSFTRVGNGTLLLYSYGTNMVSTFGTTDRFKLLDAPPEFNGIICPSVAAFQNSESPRVIDFLRYDPLDSILRRANYDTLGDGPLAIARAATSQTLNDTQVYALHLSAATLTLNAGQTLTIGDGENPAGLILNSGPTGRAIIAGGTLDFGGSEGIIWNNDRRGTYEGVRIDSVITGTQGVTIRGITINSFCEFTGANTYSGGTRVQSGALSVNGSNRLGTGDVWVYGSRMNTGGSLRIAAAATIPNNLHLIGIGNENYIGALRCEANVTFNGSVEVSDLARVTIGNGLFTATLAGGVQGTGQLEIIAGGGRLRIAAPATHTGGTRVTSGTLEIAEGGTLGGGTVQNNATLMFSNTSNIVVTNDILGVGSILLAGTGSVVFTGTTTCTILTTSTSTLGEGDYTFDSLSGTGTLSSANARLTVGGTGTDSYYAGTLASGVTLQKTGAGTLTLAGNNQNTGTLLITDGTVRLGGLPDMPTGGLVYQLDAQNDETILRDGNDTVTDWLDATPNGFDFTETLPVNRPLYRADGINGFPSVYFGGWTNRLAAQTSANVQNVFAVTKTDSANIKNMGGLWGRSGNDAGLRVQGATWQIGGGFNDNGQTYVNGAPQNAFTPNTPFLVSASSDRAQNWVTAIGDYWGNPAVNGSPRSYAGDIGEILVYGQTLNDATRIMLEIHLSDKWQLGLYPPPATSDILSPASALAIGADGVLDLNGSTEHVASLTGAGAIINSAATPATLTAGSGDFSGTIAGNITLAVDGALTLRGDRALDALHLLPGATVDLAGATLRVSRLTGTGSIINGTVIVTEVIAPEGTLELPPATVATGCTLEIALRSSTCGTLHVNGDFDLRTVRLAVTVAETLKVLDYTLLTCTGQFTGAAFASATIPPRATLRHTPQSVGLFYENGTRLILK